MSEGINVLFKIVTKEAFFKIVIKKFKSEEL